MGRYEGGKALSELPRPHMIPLSEHDLHGLLCGVVAIEENPGACEGLLTVFV